MKMLVAIEQSQSSQKALEFAVDMATKYGATLTAVVVAQTTHNIEEVPVGVNADEEFLKQAQETASKAKAYAQGKGVGLTVVIERDPNPEQSILDHAEQMGAEIIVMGSRAKSGIAKLLIGSVAANVAANAHCSVLIVR
jgi:nucleotide-binding universal stress UspA family protein